MSARCAPIRPARRSEAARTSGSARSAYTKFSVSAGTIDGGDPPRAQEVVRGRYGSCPPRRQGSAPAPCRRQIGCSLKTAGRVLLRIYSPGPDRSAFSVLAADTHEVDDFYIGAKAPGKSGRGTKQQPMLTAAGRAAAPCAAQRGARKIPGARWGMTSSAIHRR